MNDKKLTDKEIPDIKELLEYKAKVGCQNCDLIGKGCCSTCVNNLIKSFIGLFERLQAENKRLKAPTTDWLVRGISPEQLEKEKIQALMDIAKKYAKAEAYKEFAEKLHEELRIYGIKDKFNKAVFLNIVDKAKKELGDSQ